jgi:Protein of unknown function (DUF3052)
VGAEARTTLKLGRQSFAGTALLETTELLFRGDTRLKIPLASILSAEARDGALHVTHSSGVAVLTLGDAVSARWAEKIRSPRSLADKLGVKAGMRVAILGVSDTTVLADVEGKGATLVRGRVPAGAPLVLWRIATPAALTRLPRIASAIARDGAIWVIHPRGKKAVADTVIFAAAKTAGLTYTKVVRVSETDTAEKLVIPRDAR